MMDSQVQKTSRMTYHSDGGEKMEYKLINSLWQFLKRYKDEPEINAEEFMQTLEGRVAELQNEAKDDAEKRFVIEAFSVVANYLHERKKKDFV